jgi:uncharacterized protein (TIGR02466 family)
MQVEPLFPVPLYVCQVQDKTNIQNECLTALNKFGANFFSKSPVVDPISHSLSDPTFTSNLIEDINLTHLEAEIKKQVTNYLLQLGHRQIQNFRIVASWMTHTAPNEYTPVHDHASADLSGVYYIKTNGNDGDIFFMDPNPAMNATYCFSTLPKRYAHNPVEGKMIIFPGWLLHGVNSNQTEDVRISISFNILFDRS